ncbi:MAG: phage portal protein [Planctomycetes bacterium]|nr:phage portal protein [Planctomycetota bacterium]
MFATIEAMASTRASYPPDHDYWYTPRAGPTVAGVAVNEDSSLTYATVFACVNKLAKTLATLPARVYERRGDQRIERPEHWLNEVWTVRFNEETLALAGREAILANLMLWGNGYAETLTTNRGRPAGLIPLYSRYMHPVRSRETRKLEYEYRPQSDPDRMLTPAQVLHVPGLSLNGIVGFSVIGYQRTTVAMGMAATKHGASFYGNSAIPGVVLKRPVDAPELSEDAAREVLAKWNEDFMTPGKSYRTALLEEGTEATTIGMPLKDAQFLESRQFQRVEICGIFDVPPSKIHDDTRSTFSNVEQKNMDWRTDSLVPWCVRLEQAVGAKFLGGTPYYLKHNLEGLVRGDLAARSTYYQKMLRCGLSVNDWLRLEDRNGIGPAGDVRFVTKDLIPLEQAVKPPAPIPVARPFPPQRDDGDDDDDETARQRATLVALATEASQRIVTKECKAVAAAAKRYDGKAAAFGVWLDSFYGGQCQYAAAAWRPICAAASTLTGRHAGDITQTRAEQYAGTSLASLRELLATNPAYLSIELTQWQATKAATLAAGLVADLFDNGKD